MDYLARKFSRAKWGLPKFEAPNDTIRADAITGCLRTRNDTLSLWECSTGDANIREVVLAIASTMQTPDRMHIALVRKKDLESLGLEMKPSTSNTPAQELRERHVDLVEMNMHRLCEFAQHFSTIARNGAHCHVFSRAEVLEIVRQGIKDGLFLLEDLHASFQKHITP